MLEATSATSSPTCILKQLPAMLGFLAVGKVRAAIRWLLPERFTRQRFNRFRTAGMPTIEYQKSFDLPLSPRHSTCRGRGDSPTRPKWW